MMARKTKAAETLLETDPIERERLDRLPVAGATWQVWTADENETAAAAEFERRYRQPPEHVVDHGGYLWLGPVPGSLEGTV